MNISVGFPGGPYFLLSCSYSAAPLPAPISMFFFHPSVFTPNSPSILNTFKVLNMDPAFPAGTMAGPCSVSRISNRELKETKNNHMWKARSPRWLLRSRGFHY